MNHAHTLWFGILGLCLVGIVGWYVVANYPASNTKPVTQGAPIISAPFVCNDGSHFIAEFPQMEVVQIDVDGKIVKELPHASSTAGQLYKDAQESYLFQGEGVTITTPSGEVPVKCIPPVDPNNAPINFGD